MKQLIFNIFLLLTMASNAQSTEPIHVVQRQLDAYNKQDLKQFSAQFSDSVKVYKNLEDKEPSFKGKEALEKVYGDMFKQYPNNYSTLQSRIVNNNFVIDHELITGREKELKMIAIYEVKNGVIINCWFLR